MLPQLATDISSTIALASRSIPHVDSQNMGASAEPTGLSQAEPEGGLGPSGFDPSREIVAGDVFVVRYPFTFDTFEFHDVDGVEKRVSWKPGTHVERGDYWNESYSWADAEGEMILRVFGVCLLGRPYKTRILYRRQFRSPQGVLFGKSALRMATIDQFRSMASGFRYVYDIDACGEAQSVLDCDSDGSPKGGDACGSVHDSAGPKDIARD